MGAKAGQFTLQDVAARIAARAEATADASYTKSLLDGGPQRAARKFGEEAVEAVIAAVSGEASELVAESADVLYHLLVVLQARGVALDEVMAELERRTSQSGHEEKASRTRRGGE
ncbi:MAG: phosphoribosyl-ATP diphosphatase [Methylobacteriaceae bacterium]|nr:phosphoribosyl-ATP diphosphatase [Methylobacteriaceae bacterium]MBV9244421.1 phosphoribosyl-ATP diphosphatase [Methylobacteriaceae bacterium]MBV9635295.1 phosphoribosyl-ATP diphosphatase [Methylobacteriaceae bacterium]